MSFVLCVFGTVIFLLEGSIKRSTANLQIPGRRKNVCKKITRIPRNAVSRLPALFHKIEVNL